MTPRSEYEHMIPLEMSLDTLIAELEAQLAYERDALLSSASDVVGMDVRIKELEAALRWYADPGNYADNPDVELRYIEGGPGTIVDADHGKRAREALESDI